ncbi:[FeFe] hydrogenase H-cluster maturation GTPase HydF [Clostridium sp. MB40-C1]|uniref:[FeFe] hydrogenase H-cluster maturation GTPase HydF n=1 Tax=Clostridium sp. MB40-C1 TaxID=3070996 RepID=UPI0027E0B20E|nr:[FeFe] hydrogenase H-cluster maturation GTPase HydF [Clostridium sp. MB40-C1]WMJ79903.1 [FeFe] hydrogenase H-cluster maturation GTPase HydF [Clostridium sp. MB40-C1]
MNNTPNANRKHIAIYGKRNAGKSSLLNAIIGQDISLVSSVKGTTTDPVTKSMELIPLGPVVFIDTAGIDDKGELGELRVKKSLKILQRTDFGIYVMDIKDTEDAYYKETTMNFKRYNIPYITVINKIDTVKEEVLEQVRSKFKDAIFISALKEENILFLKDVLIKKIQEDDEEKPIIGDLLSYDSKVVMVVPIDSEAPKGRIILPQVQLIRDCLDNGIKSYVVRDTELQSALQDIKDVDLVVTDSQAFKRVNKIVPHNIKLTSFSILFARYKGELGVFLDGISKIKDLNENSKILISESCTHNHSHEDIGRVKIPMMLKKHTGKDLQFGFKMGHDFPEDISEYDLVIHCGACMVNRKTMLTRINFCKDKKVSITNYGVLLAYLTGILDRSIEIFKI